MRIWRGTSEKRNMRKPKVLTYRGMGMALVSSNPPRTPEQERELFNGIISEPYGRKMMLR
jgi:hypothetical protein